jgi:ribosome-binding protein aMBF1 (putative translation factor)
MDDRELQLRICAEYIGLLRIKSGMEAGQLSQALERAPDFIERVERGEALLAWDDFRDAVVVLGGDLLTAMGECVRAYASEKGLKPMPKDDPLAKRFARIVRFLRHSKGMSQREFALAIGRKPSYISAVERNGRLLDVEAVIAIAEVCEIEPDALLKELAGDRIET